MSTGSRELTHVVRALESLPIGVVVVDADEAIAFVNRPAERLFGYDRSELIGQSVRLLFPDGSWGSHGLVTASSHSLHSGESPGEVLARRKDLSGVPIQLSLSPMTIGDATFVTATAIDLTRWQRVEHELRVLRDERLQFETLLGELAADFVALPPYDADRAVEDGLARVVRALDLDRGELFRLGADGGFVRTHQWIRPGWASPASLELSTDHLPWHAARLRAGDVVAAATLDDVPAGTDRVTLLRLGIKSVLSVPLTDGGQTVGAVTFAAVRQPCAWPLDISTRLRLVAHIFARTLARKRSDDALRQTAAADVVIRERLLHENAYLRREWGAALGDAALVGNSPPMRQLLAQITEAAGTNATVLLVGEPGTGKTQVAARIHELSARNRHPMVRVPGSTLTAAHLEQELSLDHASVAPGRSMPRARLALADGSTLYFHEIADLPLDAQAILNQVLWDDGAHTAKRPRVHIDARVIASTSRNLMRCVSEGIFRDDLYFRLGAVPIRVPSLRDRLEDLPLLVWRMVDELSETYRRAIDTIDAPSMAALQEYEWPGNVRELRNVIERALIAGTGRHLHIPLPADRRGREATLAAVEKEHIAAVLAACNWRIEGEGGAASRLGLTPQQLNARVRRLAIERPRR